MTARERMLAAYRNERPDSVPVSPELWDATALAVSGRPFHELVGPFAQVPWWQTHLAAFQYFRADAWIAVAPAESPRQKQLRTTRSRFVDPGTIETEISCRTPKGALRALARTTAAYADWLLDHPVKDFGVDMPAYGEWFFTDPAALDLTEIRQAIAGVGDQGLVTPMVCELFTSFLGSARQGGMVQTLYDLVDHRDSCRRIQQRFIEFVVEVTELVLTRTPAQAIFVNSNYSGPPIISPAIYRQWDRPVLAAVAEVCRKHEAPLHLHQHGHTLAVIEDIIDAGVSMVCPLLPPPQGDVDDLAAVKKRYGSRIALKGNVDPIAILLNGTPRDVEREVRRCIEAAGEEGGFILGTADSTVAGTPFDNIHAFVEAGRAQGRYL